jgi:putative phosphoribosyl transferase
MNREMVDIAPGLVGELSKPSNAEGIVLLIDGSEGGREHRRHRFVAGYLQRRELATLVLEEQGPPPPREPAVADYERVQRLARLLLQAVDWTQRQTSLGSLAIGVFGSGLGAAASIMCAGERPQAFSAIVSRAAPLDLVADDLPRLRLPVLLLVGALDADVLLATQACYRAIESEKRLEIVSRATHLFEEAGAMERVAIASTDWFKTRLVRRPA